MNQKERTKVLICLAVLAGLFLLTSITRAAVTTTPFSENVPILMYHYIESPTATTSLPGLYLPTAVFANQLQELRRYHANPVFVSEIAASLRSEKKLPPYSMALTFDDGYQDFYTNAFPLLKKYKMKATLYIIINKLDKPGYLTKAELKELAESGLVEIGSHTFNHPDLRALKAKNAKFEIASSKIELEKRLGQLIPTFAYPFGYYAGEQLAIVKAIGYEAAVSVNPGSRHSTQDLFALKRIRPGSRGGSEFVKWLFSWYNSKY